MPPTDLPPIAPADLLVTQALRQRKQRPADLQAELRAFHELSGLMATDPKAVLPRFAELALELCQAGSAGVSLLEADESGALVFRWAALAGRFLPYTGRTTPRHHSPCGLCIDQGETILVDRPARVFTYFNDAADPIEEGLLVPFFDLAGTPLGTIWAVSHGAHRFDGTDARLLQQLAVQIVLALKVMQTIRVERRRRRRAEAAEAELRRNLDAKDVTIREVHHRVKNTLQISGALLTVQAAAARTASERETLIQANARLNVLAGIHELLYRNADNAQAVDLAVLLTAMVEALRASFAVVHGHVALELQAEAVSLNPDLAIPLALIANEAITNACKHAYPDQASGTVTVTLRQMPGGGLELAIRDAGIGMPAERRRGSMGFRLMSNLAKQIAATFTVASAGAAPAGGTLVTVTLAAPSLTPP